jgi:hypothetical protein
MDVYTKQLFNSCYTSRSRRSLSYRRTRREAGRRGERGIYADVYAEPTAARWRGERVDALSPETRCDRSSHDRPCVPEYRLYDGLPYAFTGNRVSAHGRGRRGSGALVRLSAPDDAHPTCGGSPPRCPSRRTPPRRSPIHRKPGVRLSHRTHAPVAESHRKPGVSPRRTHPLGTGIADGFVGVLPTGLLGCRRRVRRDRTGTYFTGNVVCAAPGPTRPSAACPNTLTSRSALGPSVPARRRPRPSPTAPPRSPETRCAPPTCRRRFRGRPSTVLRPSPLRRPIRPLVVVRSFVTKNVLDIFRLVFSSTSSEINNIHKRLLYSVGNLYTVW